MILNIKTKYIKEWLDASKNENLKESVSNAIWFRDDERPIEIDTNYIEEVHLATLQKVLKGHHEDQSNNGALQNLSLYFKIAKDPAGAKAGKLESLKEGLTKYIDKHSINKWLFKEEKNQFIAYVVTKIDYSKAQKDYPATVSLTMKAFSRTDQTTNSITWYHADIKGKTMKELLAKSGYILATEHLMEEYEKSLEEYKRIYPMTGEQFVSDGWGFVPGRYHVEKHIRLHTDGVYHKLVVDTPYDFELKPSKLVHSAQYWSSDEDVLKVPIHPYIQLFDLEDHSEVWVHSRDLRDYEYDETLINKLILPKEVMELIEILSMGTKSVLEDIVNGKAAGVIIGCVGAPGLGKTLSAEVYSEHLKRPLYTVQCAQLGTEPDELEKKLKEVLRRAAKWNAVLLIDEADVYIRKRGFDIKQNAIVGVFLRVLEYYKGIMFMTSNLGEDIDDAIESRFTAKITYEQHSKDELAKIWIIIADQFGIKSFTSKMIEDLVKEFPYIAGRSIRAILKLSKMLADYRKVDVDMDIIKHSAKFAIHEKKEPKMLK